MLDHIDRHARDFIALSPFCVMSSLGADGCKDTSHRGDPPGFVAVLDERTLLIPDRPGSNQVDSLRNVLAHPEVVSPSSLSRASAADPGSPAEASGSRRLGTRSLDAVRFARAQHSQDDVAATTREADDGRSVFLPLGPLAVVERPGDGVAQ